MRLLFSSDFHGEESLFRAFAQELSNGDYSCGVIAGDLMIHFSPEESQGLLSEAGLSADSFVDELDATGPNGSAQITRDAVYARALEARALHFRSILEGPGIPVLLVMGNDDGIVAGGLVWPDSELVRNINQSRWNIAGWSLVGYQYTPPFIGGLYEKPEDEQAKDFAELEELIDGQTILVTHGPPRGVLDGDSYGSTALSELVRKRAPNLHLFGHIHESAGIEWPNINGAFPRLGHFYAIEPDTKKVEAVQPTGYRTKRG